MVWLAMKSLSPHSSRCDVNALAIQSTLQANGLSGFVRRAPVHLSCCCTSVSLDESDDLRAGNSGILAWSNPMEG
jgi:hypothetical protein